jgi:hypothetical protein
MVERPERHPEAQPELTIPLRNRQASGAYVDGIVWKFLKDNTVRDG